MRTITHPLGFVNRVWRLASTKASLYVFESQSDQSRLRATACLILRPMYAIAILRYRRPLEEVTAAVDDHRAYLKTLHEQGLLVASGPAHPRNGGMLILRVPDDEVIASLDRIRDGDPYYQRGLAQYELIPWAPTIGKDALDKL